jgi:hypothetical protein
MKCLDVEIIISAHLDGEVTASEWREADTHIKTCAHCAQTLALFRNSTAFIRQHATELEPSPRVWLGIARQLEAQPKQAWRKKFMARLLDVLDNYLFHPSTAIRYIQVASAAAAVVLAVVFLFQQDFEKSALTPLTETRTPSQLPLTTPPVDLAKQQEKRQFAQALLLDEVKNYFEQAGVLLLEVKHLEPELDRERIPQIRRASQNLLEETLLLKKDLEQADLGILSQVVEQLEIVLLDLANLKEKTEKEEVELLQATILKQDLLIKIEIVDLKKMLQQDKDMLQRDPKVPQQNSINDI